MSLVRSAPLIRVGNTRGGQQIPPLTSRDEEGSSPVSPKMTGTASQFLYSLQNSSLLQNTVNNRPSRKFASPVTRHWIADPGWASPFPVPSNHRSRRSRRRGERVLLTTGGSVLQKGKVYKWKREHKMGAVGRNLKAGANLGGTVARKRRNRRKSQRFQGQLIISKSLMMWHIYFSGKCFNLPQGLSITGGEYRRIRSTTLRKWVHLQ